MVCGERCGCGAFCRRLFCRAKPDPENVNEDAVPVTLLQLSEARDVKFTQPLTEPLAIGSHIVCTGTPVEDIPCCQKQTERGLKRPAENQLQTDTVKRQHLGEPSTSTQPPVHTEDSDMVECTTCNISIKKRFALNLGCGDTEPGREDIAVHFNVRMPQRYVVRNTQRHGKWGYEETTAFRLFPFKTGKPFTIEVLVEENETLWAVDGEHYCSFAHRNPSPLAATWVQVSGVRDAALNVQKADVYPVLAPPLIEVPLRSSADAPAENEPNWKPNVIATLENGVPEGHQVIIHGRLRPLLHSFTIDLMDRAREWPRPNIHAHVNVRAHDESQRDRQLVVLNAWLGAWGPERRQRTARLFPGTKTTFRIVRSAGEWSVYADDMLIGELEYRAAAAGVRALRVRGDLYPEQIYLCPTSSSPVSLESHA